MASFRNWQIYELAILFLFFSEHTWVLSVLFLCFLDILPTYHGFLRVFLLQGYFLFSPLPLCLSCTIHCSHFFVFLVQIPEEVIRSPTSCLLDASCSIDSSSFVDCSPELCSWGQGAGCIARYTAWLQNVRGMGRAVFRKVCLAAARTVTSVRRS